MEDHVYVTYLLLKYLAADLLAILPDLQLSLRLFLSDSALFLEVLQSTMNLRAVIK